MIIKGSFETCIRVLLDRMKSQEGVRYVITKRVVGWSYTLYGLEDPDLDWSKAVSGEMRVIMCISQMEISLLSAALLPEEAR